MFRGILVDDLVESSPAPSRILPRRETFRKHLLKEVLGILQIMMKGKALCCLCPLFDIQPQSPYHQSAIRNLSPESEDEGSILLQF